jgi:hypothetical protein
VLFVFGQHLRLSCLPKDQFSGFGTRHHPADLFRRYRRIILAVSLRPSPNGTPGAKRRTTAVVRAWNIVGASIMTAPTGGRLASPKVSKK